VRWDFGYYGHYWPIVPAPDDRWGWLWRNLWNTDWQGKSKYSEKTCPSTTLSTTNPTWLDPGLKPGRRGGKPATNCFSYGAAFIYYLEERFTTVLNVVEGGLNVTWRSLIDLNMVIWPSSWAELCYCWFKRISFSSLLTTLMFSRKPHYTWNYLSVEYRFSIDFHVIIWYAVQELGGKYAPDFI
jgi:hypothetical protein